MYILGDCYDYFKTAPDQSVDLILTDPPYNASKDAVTAGEVQIDGFDNRRPIRRIMGEWDRDYDPAIFMDNAIRVLRPGGWLIICSGDSTFGSYHKIISESALLHYKSTCAWIKPNAAIRIRKINFVSSVEWVIFAIRGNDDGTKLPPVAWNWLGQANMKNYVSIPVCMPPERLYWHEVDNNIIPCVRPRSCSICKEKGINSRVSHPTQKPTTLWSWILARISKPGIVALDPFAGLGTSGIACERYGLTWTGVEIDPLYHRVGSIWRENGWGSIARTSMVSQTSFLF